VDDDYDRLEEPEELSYQLRCLVVAIKDKRRREVSITKPTVPGWRDTVKRNVVEVEKWKEE